MIETMAGSGADAKQIAACEAITEIYSRWGEALRCKNLVGLMEPLAENFCWHLPSGIRWDRAETEAALSQQLALLGSVQNVRITVHSLTVAGRRAFVMMTEEVTSAGEDTVRSSPSGQETFCSETYRDVWRCGADGWRLETSRLVLAENR